MEAAYDCFKNRQLGSRCQYDAERTTVECSQAEETFRGRSSDDDFEDSSLPVDGTCYQSLPGFKDDGSECSSDTSCSQQTYVTQIRHDLDELEEMRMKQFNGSGHRSTCSNEVDYSNELEGYYRLKKSLHQMLVGIHNISKTTDFDDIRERISNGAIRPERTWESCSCCGFFLEGNMFQLSNDSILCLLCKIKFENPSETKSEDLFRSACSSIDDLEPHDKRISIQENQTTSEELKIQLKWSDFNYNVGTRIELTDLQLYLIAVICRNFDKEENVGDLKMLFDNSPVFKGSSSIIDEDLAKYMYTYFSKNDEPNLKDAVSRLINNHLLDTFNCLRTIPKHPIIIQEPCEHDEYNLDNRCCQICNRIPNNVEGGIFQSLTRSCVCHACKWFLQKNHFIDCFTSYKVPMTNFSDNVQDLQECEQIRFESVLAMENLKPIAHRCIQEFGYEKLRYVLKNSKSYKKYVLRGIRQAFESEIVAPVAFPRSRSSPMQHDPSYQSFHNLCRMVIDTEFNDNTLISAERAIRTYKQGTAPLKKCGVCPVTKVSFVSPGLPNLCSGCFAFAMEKTMPDIGEWPKYQEFFNSMQTPREKKRKPFTKGDFLSKQIALKWVVAKMVPEHISYDNILQQENIDLRWAFGRTILEKNVRDIVKELKNGNTDLCEKRVTGNHRIHAPKTWQTQFSTTSIHVANQDERDEAPVKNFENAVYDDLNRQGKRWCRYCGATKSSSWCRSPWSDVNSKPDLYRLCIPHYVACFQTKTLDLSKWEKAPQYPIDPEKNSQFDYVARMRRKEENRKRESQPYAKSFPSTTPSKKRRKLIFETSEVQ